MPFLHIFAALIVAACWGVNFVAVRVGLDDLPPFLFLSLRFLMAAIPAVFLLRRPAMPWRDMIPLALVLFFGQFSFLFVGMAWGMPAGLTSLVLQTQAFLTLLVGMAFFGDRPGGHQWAGLAIAFSGIGLIGGGLSTAPAMAFIFILLAALSWSVGNLLMRRAVLKMASPPRMIDLMAWMSLLAAFPFTLASLLIDGPAQIQESLSALTWRGAGAVAYNAFGATLFGYMLWSILLSRHSASKVAPFSMLVPVFGMSSAALFLGETVNASQSLGAALVMTGLMVNLWGDKLVARLKARA